MLVQPVKHIALGLICSQVTDQRSFRSIPPQFFEGMLDSPSSLRLKSLDHARAFPPFDGGDRLQQTLLLSARCFRFVFAGAVQVSTADNMAVRTNDKGPETIRRHF